MKTVPFLNAKLYQFKMPLTDLRLFKAKAGSSSYVQVRTLALLLQQHLVTNEDTACCIPTI